MRAELGEDVSPGPLNPGTGPGSTQVVRISVARGAGGGGAIAVTIEHLEVSRATTQRVDLGELPPAALTRALALVIGELSRSTSFERSPPAAASSEANGPDRQEESARAADAGMSAFSSSAVRTPSRQGGEAVDAGTGAAVEARTPARVEVGAAVGLRAYPWLGTLLFEGRGGVRLPLRAPVQLGVRLEPNVHLGRAYDALGVVHLTAAAASATLELGTGAGAIAFLLGPRFELGWAWISGVATERSTTESSSNTFVCNLGVAGTLRVAVPGRVWISLGGQLGYGIRGIVARVNERRVAGTGGLFVGFTLGGSR